MAVRVLIGPDDLRDGELDDPGLVRVYEPPERAWLRANMISSVDGSATGSDGRSGSINNAPDKRVFDLLRSQADAILVGSRTAEAEGYRPTDRPTVAISRAGSIPSGLREGALLATCSQSPGLADAREVLGNDNVLVAGTDTVDFVRLLEQLAERGLSRLLTEGGPHLLGAMLEAGVVDELCATIVPTLVGSVPLRIVQSGPLDVPLELASLLEEDGTLLARWLIGSRG